MTSAVADQINKKKSRDKIVIYYKKYILLNIHKKSDFQVIIYWYFVNFPLFAHKKDDPKKSDKKWSHWPQ